MSNHNQFSPLIFGTMKWGIWGAQLNMQQILANMERSIELGITTFDHADIYGHYTTEEAFGKALKLSPSLRSKMQLISKCGIKLITPNRPSYKIHSYDTSKTHILESVDNSLRALHTDYLDLLLIHRPSPLMHPDEIAEAFKTLKDAGKVKQFGVSNFTPSQLDMLRSRTKLICNQIEASALHLSPFLDGTLDQCLQHDLVPMAWGPLGSGKLFHQLDNERVQRLRMVAAKLGTRYGRKTIDQVLIAWLLKHPAGIIPVLGTSKIIRLEAAVEAMNIEMTREEWFEIWTASTGEDVP